MMVGCCVTGVIVRKRTTKQATAAALAWVAEGFHDYMDGKDTDAATAVLVAGLQDFLNWQAEEARKAEFLSGDASFEAAVEDLADCFDELIATYAMEFGLSEDGLRTLGWTFIARVIAASSEFGKTPQEIIEKPGAWEGKVVGHAVRPQDTALTREIARDYLSGNYPDGFTPAMTFGTREAGGGFVARNEFQTGPNTMYWRYGK